MFIFTGKTLQEADWKTEMRQNKTQRHRGTEKNKIFSESLQETERNNK